MFPFLLIAVGVAVLALGRRLAVMGAAVGFLLGVGLLALFPGTSGPWVTFGLPIVLALVGFFCAAFAKGIIAIVILVIGALAGAAIVLAFLDLFGVDAGLLRWVLAVVGAVVGFVLIRRFRKGSKDWGMLILAGLVGALLVARGLTQLLPSLQGSIGTLIVIVLAGASIAFQGGYLSRRKTAAAAPAPTQAGSQTAAGDPSTPTSGEESK
jgi:hypothetical protein